MCGYRKGFTTKHALLSLTEKQKKVLDNKGYGGAVLMDISKAFDIETNKELLKLIKTNKGVIETNKELFNQQMAKN